MAALAAISCKKIAAPAPEAKPATLAAPQLQPPADKFTPPAAWQSRKGGETIQPPPLEPEVWRAFVSQTDPIQRKTPLWQPLAPTETVELAMPPGSRFRCLVTPLVIKPDANDFGTKLKAWQLSRKLLCSDDGWHSWTEYSHGARIEPTGERELAAMPEALLRERADDQTIHHTFVLLRSDKERREATVGPPKILTGVPVDED